ncbi:MAG: thioether cross-link-forming SCIFF peptide maturase, partial [Clostridia bacterium]|nr:thioether cross-link-forming SCIFF peptide maturase [Clostridia bacterium]
YSYKNNTYYFIWDVESGSLLNVDSIAFLCAKKRYEQLSSDEIIEFNKLNPKDIKEIEEEFIELENQNKLNAKPQITSFKKNLNEIKALCLHVCHDCNLNCVYCFAGGGTYNTEKDYMSKEVGKEAIDFLLANSGSRKNLEIDFFGGEPLLNMDTVKYVVEYGNKEASKIGKVINFTMTTNCLLLNEDNINYLNKYMDNVVLSIDGRECIHNATRKTKNGKDVYKIILQNAQNFRKVRGDKKYYVRATFTANNLDFVNDIITLNDNGFDQISVEPVVLKDNDPLALKEEHLSSILNEYDKLTEVYLDRRKNGKWFNFFHFMIDLEHGSCQTKRLNGCGAGVDYLAVSPIGEIYPCHQFVGKDDFKIGNVFDKKLNNNIREQFANICVLNKKHCENCFAKYHCSGGCNANAYNFTGRLDGQYKIGCELAKKRLECSLAIAAIEKINNQ